MAQTHIGRSLQGRPIPWSILLRWLPKAPRAARLYGRLLADRRVPRSAKLLLGLAVVYLLSPVDLLPEVAFSLFGMADDLALLGLALRHLLAATPEAVLAEHLTAVGLEL